MGGARTPLFSRHQQGGLFTIEDVAEHPGDIYFVHSGTGTNGAGYGQNPDAPVATIDYAIGLCAANKGDVIYVLPGHAETINTVGGITADIAGISIIGLGNGEDRGLVTVGSSLDTATVLISAADVKIANLVFEPGNDGVDVLIDIDADGAIIEDCEMRSDETNAYQADTYIDIAGGANGADRCTVRRCKITSITAGAAQAINIGAVEDALVIEDNWIDGDFSAAGILSGSIFTSALIRRNVVSNRAAGVHAIEFTAACTGLLVDNRMYSSTLGTILDPGSLKCLGNLETDAIDQAGVDSPRVAAGGFPDNSITADSIAVGAIAADAFAAGAIDAAAIAAGAIDAATFAAGAIDAAAIANGAIDAATFAAGAIDAAAIATGAIDADAIANDAIDAGAIAASALTAAKFAGSIENCIEKSDGAVLTGTDDLFTVSGGPVYAMIIGVVDTVIGGVANGTLQHTTTTPAATVSLSTTVAIDSDAAGTSYRFVGATGVLTPDTSGAKIIDPVTVADCWFLLPIGTVNFLGSAAQSGVIKWYMRYKPLSPSSVVAAAA